MSIADEIKKLGDLRNQGLITDAEFEGQKAALLAGGSALGRQSDTAPPMDGLHSRWAGSSGSSC